MSIYELVVLGSDDADLRERLSATVTLMIGDFGMALGDQLVVRTAADVDQRNIHAATVGVYFGDPAHLRPKPPSGSRSTASLSFRF